MMRVKRQHRDEIGAPNDDKKVRQRQPVGHRASNARRNDGEQHERRLPPRRWSVHAVANYRIVYCVPGREQEQQKDQRIGEQNNGDIVTRRDRRGRSPRQHSREEEDGVLEQIVYAKQDEDNIPSTHVKRCQHGAERERQHPLIDAERIDVTILECVRETGEEVGRVILECDAAGGTFRCDVTGGVSLKQRAAHVRIVVDLQIGWLLLFF